MMKYVFKGWHAILPVKRPCCVNNATSGSARPTSRRTDRYAGWSADSNSSWSDDDRRGRPADVRAYSATISVCGDGDEGNIKRWEDIFDRLAAEAGALVRTVWQEIASDPDEYVLRKIWWRIHDELEKSGLIWQIEAPSFAEVCARFRG